MTTEQQKSPISRYLLDEVSTHCICISKKAVSCTALLTRGPRWQTRTGENEGLRGRGKRIDSRLECRYGPKNVNLAFKASQATLTTLSVVLKGIQELSN